LQPYLFSDFNNNEILNLFKRYHNGDNKALDLIVKGHFRLVSQIAHLFVKNNLSLDDLIQEGYIGLLKSIASYDYNKGIGFASYAQLSIYHRIKKSIHLLACPIRIPERHILFHNKIRKLSDEFKQKK
jgi:RNA polymerase primary sigma factor